MMIHDLWSFFDDFVFVVKVQMKDLLHLWHWATPPLRHKEMDGPNLSFWPLQNLLVEFPQTKRFEQPL